MTKPIVSIITPSFNQGRFIEETIKSVISQEGDFFLEYLIMDGGSTDDSVEVMERYGRLLKEGKWPVRCKGIEYRWVREKDNGQADAVNKGFRAAKGEVLGWINSDDTYIPGAIKKAKEFLEAHKDVLMVYGEGNHINEGGEIIERYPTELDIKRLAEACFICQPTVFLRRRVFEEVGFLDPNLHYCMDYEYWIRISKKLKMGHIRELLANSRLHPETKTASKRLEACEEAVGMLKRRYGRVPASWVFAYAHVKLENRLRRGTPFRDYLFKAAWGLFSAYEYLRINGPLARKNI